MKSFTDIFRGNLAWAERKLAEDPAYFERLAQGQEPSILYIGCSDSRVTAEELMGAQPGEIFVHRNVANLVVVTDNNLNAVVQFAVEHLKVQHVVVCGHTECGGVRAALEPRDMGQLNAWLQTLRDVYRLHKDDLDAIGEARVRFDRLVELNVLEQCMNVLKIDHVQRAIGKTGFPEVHGWVFDVRSGQLKDLGLKMDDEFSHLRKIYDLNSKRA